MGGENSNAKTGVFSHLFDWNRKSRRKLFANGGASSEEKKQARGRDDCVSAGGFCVSDNCVSDARDARGTIGSKAGFEYTSAYLVDDGAPGRKAPGIVARLMGLDSLPNSGVAVPPSSPLLESRSSNGAELHQSSTTMDVGSHFFDMSSGPDLYSSKPAELKGRRMPSSPVEKFGMEVLPPQSSRPVQLLQSKLLSPMRNPRFISPDNAADIMEAAAKMYELGLKRDSGIMMARMRGSFSNLLKDSYDSQEGTSDFPNSSNLLETSSKPTGLSGRRKFGDAHCDKSWNTSESVPTSSGQDSPTSGGGNSRGKSASIAMETKVSVPKKEGRGIQRSFAIDREHNDSRQNRRSRNASSGQQTKKEKRVCTPTNSAILKLNNQKQNSMMNRVKVPAIPSSSSQKLPKIINRTTQQTRNRSSNTVQELSKHPRKGASELGKETTSSTAIKNPRYKRSTETEVKKNGMLANSSISRHEKHVRSHIIIDECVNVKRDHDNKKGTADVVSFTFTSPITKSIPENWPSDKVVGKQNRSAITNSFGARGTESSSNAKKKASPVIGVNVIRIDSLVRNSAKNIVDEFTTGLEPAYSSGMRTSIETNSSSGDLLGALESLSAHVAVDADNQSCCGDKEGSCSLPAVGSFSFQPDVQNPDFKQQGGESFKSCSIGNEVEESDHLQPSPFSVLEACFSGGSCESSESCSSIAGQDHDGSDSALLKELNHVGGERGLEEEPTVMLEKIVYDGRSPRATRKNCIFSIEEEEINYVRDVLSTVMLDSAESRLGNRNATLDGHVYDQLELNKIWFGEDRGSSMKRKLLFDCVRESLDLRSHRQLLAGFKSWANGMEGPREDRIAEEIYKDIVLWRSMESWMVDELVDRDFCRHLGRCVDLDTDAFELGAEIEDQLLDILIDETVAVFLVEETNHVAAYSLSCGGQYPVDFQDYCVCCS